MSLQGEGAFDVFVDLGPHLLVGPALLPPLDNLGIEGASYSQPVLQASSPNFGSQLHGDEFLDEATRFFFEAAQLVLRCSVLLIELTPVTDQLIALSISLIWNLALVIILIYPRLKQLSNSFN